MIDRLIPVNFQRFTNQTVCFGPVTSIVGPTDSGKSTILRCLRWVCLNDLNRVNITNWDANRVDAELGIDGHVVARSKGRDNTYHLDGKRFDAVGTAVPDEVARLVNVGEDNFQRQFDLPLWFFDTAGEVSKQLNRIVNLDVIDDTLANAAGETRRVRGEVESTSGRLAAAEARKADLAWVPAMDTALRAVEAKDNQVSQVHDRFFRLEQLIHKARSYGVVRQDAAGVILCGQKAAAAGTKVTESKDRIACLTVLTDRLRRVRADHNRLRTDHQALDSMLHRQLAGQQCPLCGSKLP